MEMIRAFVAVELDTPLLTALRQLQARFRRDPLSQIGRWVAPEGIHLTLKFLGDVRADRVQEITGAVETGCQGFGPFNIGLSDPGFFPNARGLRVVWVGVGGDVQTLLRLQSAVESELNRIGFPPERRGFLPHLTLARIRDQATSYEREQMAKLVAATRADASATMLVNQVCLIRSELRPSGAVYTRLGAAPLGRPES
jgi:2'-5' RNA ligase